MQNEPNFKNTKINLTPVKRMNYENNQPFTRKQNEPNLLKHQINVSSLSKKVCVNFRPLAHRKNEPNSNPIYRFILSGVEGKINQFIPKVFAVFEQLPLIYVLFFLIFTNFHANSPTVYALSTLYSDENSNFHPLGRTKNETKITIVPIITIMHNLFDIPQTPLLKFFLPPT